MPRSIVDAAFVAFRKKREPLSSGHAEVAGRAEAASSNAPNGIQQGVAEDDARTGALRIARMEFGVTIGN